MFSNPIENSDCETAWLAFPILINDDAPLTRREFQIFLEKRKIQTRVVFTGNILRQPMCKNIQKLTSKYGYQNSDNVMKYGVLLPVHHGMTVEMFDKFNHTIKKFLEKYK